MTNADGPLLKSRIDYKIETLEEQLFQLKRSQYIGNGKAIRIQQIEYAIVVLKSLIPEEWINND